MTHLVRPGRPEDLEPLAALDDQAGAGSQRRIRIDDALSGDGGWCLVAEVAGRAAGYVVVAPGHFFGRDFVELLVVGRAHRRAGVGRDLLRAAVAATVEISGEAVFTSTNASNTPMQALLLAEGWTVSGTLVGLDEDDPEVVFLHS